MKFAQVLLVVVFVPAIFAQSFEKSDIVVTTRGNWPTYLTNCQNSGLLPISIHDAVDAQNAYDACREAGGSPCYIGLIREGHNQWRWVDSSPYNFQAWDSGQPGSSETVVVVHPGTSSALYSWHDWGNGASDFVGLCTRPASASSSVTPTISVSKSISPSISVSRSISPSISMSRSSTRSRSPSKSSSASRTPSKSSSASRTPSPSSSRTASRSTTRSTSSTSQFSRSASSSPGICNEYCVGVFGLCQQPLWEDSSCYPFDSNGECPVGTVSCPNVIPADTVATCNNCIAGTTGPCQHLDNTCVEYVGGTGVCPVGLTFCGSAYYSFTEISSNQTSHVGF